MAPPTPILWTARCIPANATLSLMEMIDATCDVECLLSVDLYHALDSPRKLLILQTLDNLGMPLPLLQIIQSVLQKGTTTLRGTEETGIDPTFGIQLGCPVSCLLSVVVSTSPSPIWTLLT